MSATAVIQCPAPAWIHDIFIVYPLTSESHTGAAIGPFVHMPLVPALFSCLYLSRSSSQWRRERHIDRSIDSADAPWLNEIARSPVTLTTSLPITDWIHFAISGRELRRLCDLGDVRYDVELICNFGSEVLRASEETIS